MKLELLEFLPQGEPLSYPPLVFVHGASHAAWCFQNYGKYFSQQGFHVYALSLRGHGQSEGLSELQRFGLKDYVEDLESILKTLKGAPILVGHSLGAAVVMKTLETSACAGLVLLAPMMPYQYEHSNASFHHFLRYNLLCYLDKLLFNDPRALVKTKRRTRRALFTKETPEEIVERTFGLLQDESSRALGDVGPNVFSSLPQKLVPCFVLGGEEDTVIYREDILYAAKIYQGSADFLKGSGHDLMLDLPWREGAERIKNWILSQSSLRIK